MDYPRFERIEGPADRLHERYHGGRLVTLVFAIVDAWRSAGWPGGLRQAEEAGSSTDLMTRLLRRCGALTTRH